MSKLTKSQRNQLTQLLKYRHAAVIAQFQRETNLSPQMSRLVFKDMLRFLWLSHPSKRSQQKKSKTPQPIHGLRMWDTFVIIDEMWHLFVLHTLDYQKFCEKYFGGFIHHIPEVPSGKSRALATDANHPLHTEFASSLDLVESVFGTDVAYRWYVEYKKFNKVKIRQMQLRATRVSSRV